MNPQNEKHEDTESLEALSYKMRIKNYINSSSEEKCKDCFNTANLLTPGSIPKDETTTYKEKLIDVYDKSDEKFCKKIFTLTQKVEKGKPGSEKHLSKLVHSVLIPLHRFTHQDDESKEDEEFFHSVVAPLYKFYYQDDESEEDEEDEDDESDSPLKYVKNENQTKKKVWFFLK